MESPLNKLHFSPFVFLSKPYLKQNKHQLTFNNKINPKLCYNYSKRISLLKETLVLSFQLDVVVKLDSRGLHNLTLKKKKKKFFKVRHCKLFKCLYISIQTPRKKYNVNFIYFYFILSKTSRVHDFYK